VRLTRRRLAALIGASVMVCATALPSAPAGAATDSSTLVGEGGSFLTPVTDVLLKADTGLSPLNPSYDDANIDNAIGDFAGTGPGDFGNDFVVSERPLTTAEASTAKSNGRTFAYVPFAATPVAIATLAVCSQAAIAANSLSGFCHDLQLTVPLVAALFTANLTSTASTPNTNLFPALTGWGDPRITLPGGGLVPEDDGVYQASTLEPSAENTALLTLIDSDPTAREELDNALDTSTSDPQTTSDAPSETWPFHSDHAWVGGDAGLVGKELSINAETNAPTFVSDWAGLGGGGGPYDVFPLASVWSGSPEGTPWDVPTAALQNAQGAFVAPTESAASAAEADATLDPTTNLVTFNANPNDAAAYNNYMMVESYLVVPTSGLPAQKAQKLAQYIRFMVGPLAQSDESTLGSAPPTPAMISADLKVATELDAEAATATAGSGGSSTSSSSTANSTASTGSSSSGSTGTGTAGSESSDGSGTSGSPGLAFTGGPDLIPVVGFGAVLLLLGAYGRRRFRRSEVKS
jgi:hypothetical protein